MLEQSKVLIVDDEPLNVDYLQQELEDLGYVTISAADGQEALEKVAAAAPDVILLDVMMPIVDGFTVCRILKGNEETRLIPIVIMTALDGIEDRIKGIEAGADDFLTKPVNERELAARLQTTLRLKHTVDRKIGELRRINNHFAKFVPEAIKHRVATHPEAVLTEKQEQDISVLFVDISGYTCLSEQLPPKVLDTLVERYFSAFLDRIYEAGGDINMTAGDGFMTIFEGADGHPHAAKAIDTALDLLAITETLNQDNNEHPLAIHMGLNSGIALVGSTRFEGVHGARWTFTANGPVTNLAARLAGVARAGHILVGPGMVQRLGDGYRLEKIGRQRLKNITATIDIYRVIGRSVLL